MYSHPRGWNSYPHSSLIPVESNASLVLPSSQPEWQRDVGVTSLNTGVVPVMAVREPTAFASLLKHWRLAVGLTQEELAERAGLSAELLGRWKVAHAASRTARPSRSLPTVWVWVVKLGATLKRLAADR
jgi:hypothetical protein